MVFFYLHSTSFKSIYTFSETSLSDLNGKVAGVVRRTMGRILHECAISNGPGSAGDKSPRCLTGTCNLFRSQALVVSPGHCIFGGRCPPSQGHGHTNDCETRA